MTWLGRLTFWICLSFVCCVGYGELNPEQMSAVENAVPDAAPAVPAKPRRLLIYDANVGYGGHGSIPYANHAFAVMGKKTGAFETVVSRDPEVFRKDSLRTFDGVFLNNNVGNLFEDPVLRRNLVEFVYGGGGLMGVHGTTVAFTRWPGAHEDWPEFGRMIGGRGASHLTADERILVNVEEPKHAICEVFGGKNFEYSSEFFRVHGPYSRNRVRVLLSIHNEESAKLQGKETIHKFREDDDYALAWVRNYGRGRVFYSTIAHGPADFLNSNMLKFYLAGTQFILGDLDGGTVPSGKLTDAIRAQEGRSWRLGVEAYTFHKYNFFETIDKTADLGLAYVGGLSFQKVSNEIQKNFDPNLTDEELKAIRLKLDDAGLRLLGYYYHDIPADEDGCRKVFEFARKMGIEIFLTEPKLDALDTIERFCDEYDIKVGLHNHDEKGSPTYWHPNEILKVCEGRSERMGACGDFGYWMRSGIDPVDAVKILKGRLLTVQMHDLDALTPEGHDVPWGTGVGKVGEVILTMNELGVVPVMWGLEYSYDFEDNEPEMKECIAFFDEVSLSCE